MKLADISRLPNRVAILLVALLSTSLIAGENVIDASSSQLYRMTSIQLVRDLHPGKAAQFSTACRILIERAKQASPENTSYHNLIKTALHGKTVEEIMAEAALESQ